MKHANNPHIVEYFGTYKIDQHIWVWWLQWSSSELSQVVMEYMGQGSVTDILELYPEVKMQESHIAAVCLAVWFTTARIDVQ